MFTEYGSLFNHPDWPPVWVLLSGFAIIFLIVYTGRGMEADEPEEVDEPEEDDRDDDDISGGEPCLPA